MKQKRFLMILMYILIIALPSGVYLIDKINNNSSFLYCLSGVLGITAYVLFSFQILLASRTKFIDKLFGLDRVYRFHMIMAIVAIAFAYLHKVIKEMDFPETFKTQLGDFAFASFIAISVFSILMMVNKLFLKINPIDKFRKLLNDVLRLKYQFKVLIHNLVLVSLTVLLVHILLAYSVSSNIALKITLIAYFMIPLMLYFNHKIVKVYFNKSKRYTVSEVIEESNNIMTLKFKPQQGKVFNYLPGQFLYVRLNSKATSRDEHPFTISSSPSTSEYVSITAKKLGDFTSNLSKVKIGDTACIDGGFGSFSYMKTKKTKKLCFIAGGIGITPFLSMLRYMKDTDKTNEVVLFWGVRNLTELICKNELEVYVSEFDSFNFIPVVSNEENYQGEKGYINNKIVQKYVEDIFEYDFYICGPPIMMEAQLKNLKALGIPKGRIHFEGFSI